MTHPDDERAASSGTPSAQAQSPIDLLEEEHELFMKICKTFEQVADDLPEEANFDLARRAAEILNLHQPDHYADEAALLFHCLRAKVGTDHVISKTLDQLERHRIQDADILIELNEVLNFGVRSRRPDNPEMLGYMLRFYFIGERRQIEWERAIVLPAARILMSETDLARLHDRLSASDRFKPAGPNRLTVRHSI
jgi:hemerythrin-like domain-containing protein